MAHTAISATTSDTTKGTSGLRTGSEPHDAEVGQPANLEGNPGCKGTITGETNGDPKHNIMNSR